MAEDKFYEQAKEYWEQIPATVDGMLGGFSHISSTDIGGSNRFLRPLIKGPNAKTKTHRALDCGAGIGRITKLFLSTIFDQVDMVELNQEFLNQAHKYMGDRAGKLGRLFCSGLQDFTPDPKYYDIIWCQWVLGHLTDDDLVAFLKRCQEGLSENGFIILKENTSASRDFDKADSSYTGKKEELIQLINRAELSIVKCEKQKNFPKEIYDVWMFVLR